MAAYIPLDVMLTHTFKILPVRSVVICACVCKDWLQILSGSEFRKIHIQHQIKDNRHYLKLLCGPLKTKFGNDVHLNSYSRLLFDIYRISLKSEDELQLDKYNGIFYSLDLETQSPTLTRLPGFPVNTYLRPVWTLGYSNSMLCMEVWDSRVSDTRRYIMFFNPSTSYYHVLPDLVVLGPIIVGFGYDSDTDDYKFVKVDLVSGNPRVYSLKSNSWRKYRRLSDEHKIQLDISSDRYRLVGNFVEGSVYWLVKNRKTIVGFSLKDKKFIELTLPRFRNRGLFKSNSLKVLQGKLCVIITVCSIERNKINVDMWWLKEDNKWSKLLNLTDLCAEYIYPLVLTDDGRVLCCADYKQDIAELHPRARYALINLRTSKIEDFYIPGINDGILSDCVFQSHFPGYIC